MSHQTQHSKPTELESTQRPSTDSPSKETPSNEVAWLVSGLLILVVGIGGVLMASQEEELRVESSIPVGSNQLAQVFPSQAIASPSDPKGLPVSMSQGITSPDDEKTRSEIEEKIIYFDFGQAVLSDEAKTLLAPQAQLQMNDNKTILVRGHTDRKGSESYNQNLSIRRAKAVKEYLVSLGHPAESIHVEGFGKAQPACSEFTEACATQNRRANLFFSKSDSAKAESELLVSQTTSESDQSPMASPEAPTEVTESESDTQIETVQLTESAEEIMPNDPIASTTTPQ